MLNINYEKLFQKADEGNQNFNKNEFKRIVFDYFLGKFNFDFISKHFPTAESNLWKETNYKHTMQKSVFKKGNNGLKEELLDNLQRHILLEFNSGMFIHFLERLTGIEGLVPDPHYAESGFHLSRDTGSLEIHADFSHHDQLKLERRLNFIYYVNEDYDPSYGGSLVLYDKKLNPIQTVNPYADNCVIFETNTTSYHGFPEPMNFPKGKYRRSIAMYYYTVSTTRKPHRIIFPRDKEFKYETGFGS
jgi:Rps23 Pro-64 3,4-dihydroxylase Tpa1-like proline 4-hydroxylase